MDVPGAGFAPGAVGGVDGRVKTRARGVREEEEDAEPRMESRGGRAKRLSSTASSRRCGAR